MRIRAGRKRSAVQIALVDRLTLPEHGSVDAHRCGFEEDVAVRLAHVDRAQLAVGHDLRPGLQLPRDVEHARDVHDTAQRQDPEGGAGTEQLACHRSDGAVATRGHDHVITGSHGVSRLLHGVVLGLSWDELGTEPVARDQVAHLLGARAVRRHARLGPCLGIPDDPDPAWAGSILGSFLGHSSASRALTRRYSAVRPIR